MRMSAIVRIILVASAICLHQAENALLGNKTSGCQIDRPRSSLECRNVDLLAEVSSALEENLIQGINKIDIYRCNFETLSAFLTPELLVNDTTIITIEKVAVVQSGVRLVALDVFAGLDLGVLSHVDFSGNLLQSVPEALLQLTSLQTLILAQNLIHQLPPGSAFNNLNSLTYLDLSNNRLGQLSSNQSSNLVTFNDRNSSLTLIAFNLEPLTDSLEYLNMRGNSMEGLPMQFRGRNFARLRTLDLSHNNIKVIPQDAFIGMDELETLDLEQNQLRSFGLSDESASNLQVLLLEGNPLDCDCHARWLWNLAKDHENGTRKIGTLKLPYCTTPFSVKNLRIENLEESILCDLLPGNHRPRFFRVSKQDEASFPPRTFETLELDQVEVISNNSIFVKWHLDLDFYYTDYDWGLIFRRIGDVNNPNMFYKTKHDLKTHVERHAEEWTPKNEVFEAVLDSMDADTYYEVCLAVVDRSTVYYLHRSHCKEIRTEKIIDEKAVVVDGPVRTENITILSDTNSITVKWNITVVQDRDEKTSREETYTLIRRISIRPFGSDNITRLFVLEDFNLTSLAQKSNGAEGSPRYYTLSQLRPSTGYIVCFETLPDPAEEGSDDQKEVKRLRKSEAKDSGNSCWEMTTLDEDIGFPVTEVASAAAVSTTTTAFVVAIVCCCCFPSICKRDKKKSKNQTGPNEVAKKDENDNERGVQENGEGPKLRAHLSRRGPDASRSSESPVRSASLPPSTSSFEPELQSIAISKSDDEDDDLPTQDVIGRERDVKFRERYEPAPEKPIKNTHFWKSCLSEGGGDRRKRERRSLSADGSEGVRYALIERRSDGNLSQKSDSKKNSNKKQGQNSKSDPTDDAAMPYYFSPMRFEGNWSECASALATGGQYNTMPNPTRHDVAHFSKRLFGSGRVGGPPPPPPPLSSPPSFLTDGSLLAMYDSRRMGMPVRPPNPSPHHHHHHHPYHPGLAQYPVYKRPLGDCYYTPPQPEYYQRQPPPAHIHVHIPQRQFWQEPPVDYARTLGRTRREAPVASTQAQPTKPEMSKLKRLLFVRAANNNNATNSKEELKMCTWSPYTSYECPDYGHFRMKDKVKPPQKSLDELRF